jgi:hypothetical protein
MEHNLLNPENLSSDDDVNRDNDSDDDVRARVNEHDKRGVRGRTPRIESHSKALKLFKIDPPEKYSSEKQTERTYEAVQLFLSQLSRCLRLATHIDMDKDISGIPYILPQRICL